MTAKRWFLVVWFVAAAALIGFLAWLPFDVLEEPAGPADEAVPAGVDSAWRFDGPSLLASPFVRSAWNLPSSVELRANWNFEARVLRPIRALERAVAGATLGLADAPSFERDIIPAEVVAATRGDDVLVVSRTSSRAKAIDLVQRLDASRMRSLGITVEGARYVVDAGDAGTFHVTRHSDLLLVSTSPALLADALRTVERGAGGLDEVPGAREALGIGAPCGEHVLGWVRPAPLALRLDPREPDADPAEAPWWARLLREADAEPLRIDVGLGSPDALDVEVRLAWSGGLRGAPAVFAGGSTAPERARVAWSSATSEETIAAGGVAVPARSVLAALLGSQPPEQQEPLELALAASGESIESLAASFAAHFEDGASFVVGRLREADAAMKGDAPGTVHAIPSTIVRLTMKGPDAARSLLEELRRRADTLFGAPLGDTVEVLGDGTRIHTLARHGLAGQWELLRPAFAFRGTDFWFSTHDGALRRLLATAPAGDVTPGVRGGAVLATVRADGLRRWVDDQVWEAADRATWRDWAAERKKVEAAIPAESQLRGADRTTYVDARIREMRRIRTERDIPRVAAELREKNRWLERFGDAWIGADAADGSVTVRMRVAPAR